MRKINNAVTSAFCAGLLNALTLSLGNTQTLGADRPQITGAVTAAQAAQIGLRENLGLRAAQSDVKAAGAETKIAKSQTYPQISANTYLAFGDSNNILFSAGTVAPVNYFNVPSEGFADQNVTLSVPIYTGGRLQNQVRAASERERAAASDLSGTQAETVLRIKEAYYRALLGTENVKSAQSRFDAAAEMVRTSQALFTAGKGLESAVRRVEAEQADAQRIVTTARNSQAKALLDLKAAMGVRLDSDLTLADTLTFAPPTGDLNAHLADAAKRRPELRAIRFRQSAAARQTDAVRGSQGAQIYGMAMADGFTSHPQGTREGYTVGVVVSLPLFDGGQRRAETAQARARQERADAEVQDMALRVAVEVQQAWLDVETAAENYKTAQSALQSAQSAYDVTTLRVQNQKALPVEQLDALASLTQAKTNIAQALYDHSLAIARLNRAAGRP